MTIRIGATRRETLRRQTALIVRKQGCVVVVAVAVVVAIFVVVVVAFRAPSLPREQSCWCSLSVEPLSAPHIRTLYTVL